MTNEITLGRLHDFAKRCLPEGWTLWMRFVADGCSLVLEGPGDRFSRLYVDPANLAERFLDLVNQARHEEGMTAVNIKGGSES